MSAWLPNPEVSLRRTKVTFRANNGSAHAIRCLRRSRRPSFNSGRRRVAGENIVVIFSRRVAGETRFMQRLIAGLAFGEVGKSPSAGRDIFI